MSRDGDPNSMEANASLYERHFFSWTLQQADLLRSGHLQALDVAHLLEEIETLSFGARFVEVGLPADLLAPAEDEGPADAMHPQLVQHRRQGARRGRRNS